MFTATGFGRVKVLRPGLSNSDHIYSIGYLDGVGLSCYA